MIGKNAKVALFFMLVLSLAVPPVSGELIQKAFATNTVLEALEDGNPFKEKTTHPDYALRRVIELEEMRLDAEVGKKDLELEKKSADATRSSLIDEQIQKIDDKIDSFDEEFKLLQNENIRRHYIPEPLKQEMRDAIDIFWSHHMEKFTDPADRNNYENYKAMPAMSISLDGLRKSIVITMDSKIVNSLNIATYEQRIAEIIPKGVPWYIQLVSSDNVGLDICTSRQNCDPVIGGSEIGLDSPRVCTPGLEATRYNVNGFVTAGHCLSVVDSVYHPYNGEYIGIVNAQRYFCDTDCGFANTSSDTVDNGMYGSSPTMINHT